MRGINLCADRKSCCNDYLKVQVNTFMCIDCAEQLGYNKEDHIVYTDETRWERGERGEEWRLFYPEEDGKKTVMNPYVT